MSSIYLVSIYPNFVTVAEKCNTHIITAIDTWLSRVDRVSYKLQSGKQEHS